MDAAIVNSGDTAWMLISTALVVFMIPGLALFYGGMTRSKNILGTMMHSIIAMGVITLQWIFVGYSLAFSEGNGFIGSFDHIFLKGITPDSVQGTIPTFLFIAFQGTFACITPALIAGAIAERVKFSSYIVFILAWSTLVYDPVCHWIWASTGFLLQMGTIDFAGGAVVHLISGIAGLVACLMLGARIGFNKQALLPHNLVYTVLGTGILWFGWFGFNAGSALTSNNLAALAFLNTFVSPAAGMVAWLLAERIHLKKSSALGAVSGAVAGLATITPAAGSVLPQWAMLMGAVVSVICYIAVSLKHKLGYDDSLDAFGVHGISGIFGILGCGIFASYGFNSLVYMNGHPELRNGMEQFMVQVKTVGITGVYSVVMTVIIIWVIKKTIGFRLTKDEEQLGIDLTSHGENAYNN